MDLVGDIDSQQPDFAFSRRSPRESDVDISIYSKDLNELVGKVSDTQGALVSRSDFVTACTEFSLGQKQVQLSITPFGRSVGLAASGVSESVAHIIHARDCRYLLRRLN